jgi:hypothetical protein
MGRGDQTNRRLGGWDRCLGGHVEVLGFGIVARRKMGERCDIGRAGGRGEILLVYKTSAATRDMSCVEWRVADGPESACQGDCSKETASVTMPGGRARRIRTTARERSGRE